MQKVTIIVPCYNSELYINRCIESFKKQVFTDFRIIFVDDASKDKTCEKINELMLDSNIEFSIIQNNINMGPAMSRNIGVEHTSTDLLAFCDSDDWYDPYFLSELVSLIENNDGDIAFCGYSVVSEDGRKDCRQLKVDAGIVNYIQAINMGSDSLCMMVVKTKIMKDTLLPDIRNGEDMAVIPLLLQKASVITATPKSLYNYCRRSNSASETPSENVVNSLLISFEHIKNNSIDNKTKEIEYIGIENVLYASIITLFSYGIDIKKANRIVNDFEMTYPNWKKNPYMSNLPLYKKLVIYSVGKRNFIAVKCLAEIRSILT